MPKIYKPNSLNIHQLTLIARPHKDPFRGDSVLVVRLEHELWPTNIFAYNDVFRARPSILAAISHVTTCVSERLA